MEWLVDKPIAHRGLHSHDKSKEIIPENSLAACQAAIDAGMPIEIDIHLTKYGEILVFHDYYLRRMTGRGGNIKRVRSNDLSRYQLLGTAETIPTLQDVLKLVDGQVPLLIELKTRKRDGVFEEYFVDEISAYKGVFAVQSFNPFVVNWFHQNRPDMNVGQLIKGNKVVRSLFKARYNVFDYVMEQLKCRPDFIVYDVDNLNPLTAFFWRQKKLPLLTWTIRSKRQEATARKYADNYIFDQCY